MKVAIRSGVPGNLPAMEAAVTRIDRRAPELVATAGDIVRVDDDRVAAERDFGESGFIEQGAPLARIIFAAWPSARLADALLAPPLSGGCGTRRDLARAPGKRFSILPARPVPNTGFTRRI
jgi:hypothetical protein